MAKMPMNPKAGVAGPGPFSVRTDQLRLPSAGYGEGVQTQAIQQGAPLAKTPDVRGAQASQVRQAAAQGGVTPLYAPTDRPQEPITHGIDMGPGDGSAVLGMNQAQQQSNVDKDFLAKYMPMLETIASSPDSSETFRIFVRSIQSIL